MWIATREGRSVSAAEQVDVIDFRNQYRIRIGDSPCRYRRREMAGRTIHSCVSEEQILPLADRHADVFIARPDSEGPWPVILFYMDAPGIRPELHDMARRLASRGYLVVLPNLFYRQGLNLRLDRKSTRLQSLTRNSYAVF